MIGDHSHCTPDGLDMIGDHSRCTPDELDMIGDHSRCTPEGSLTCSSDYFYKPENHFRRDSHSAYSEDRGKPYGDKPENDRRQVSLSTRWTRSTICWSCKKKIPRLNFCGYCGNFLFTRMGISPSRAPETSDLFQHSHLLRVVPSDDTRMSLVRPKRDRNVTTLAHSENSQSPRLKRFG